jgi:hypothetical protein
MNDDELNELIARHESETAIFREIDLTHLCKESNDTTTKQIKIRNGLGEFEEYTVSSESLCAVGT